MAAVAPLYAQIQNNGYAPEPVLKQECKLTLFNGLNNAYNEQYFEAEDRFDEYARCDPSDPIAEWRKSYSWWLRLKAEQTIKAGKKVDAPKVDAKTYTDFMTLAERGVKKAQAKVAAGDSPDFYRYVIAELKAVEAIMTFRNDGIGSYFKSRDLLFEVHRIAEASHYQDAKHLRGMMKYQASLSFWGRRFLPYDRCGGLGLIQEAVRGNHGIFSDDIRFVVANLAMAPARVSEENKFQCGVVWSKTSSDELLVRYPHGMFLRRNIIGSAK